MTTARSRKLAIGARLLSSPFPRPASAEEDNVVPKPTESTLTVPFWATVKPSFLHVSLRPEPDSPEVGLLPASHGCINLALADARWLFDWAPPLLPDNWHTIDPRAAGLSSLWVFVKERATLNQLPQFSAAGSRPAPGM